jgi:RHS repeat-associated protein
VVQANSSARTLTVNGVLSAVGTAADAITFSSSSDSAPGQWNGITFAAGAGASTITNARVRYGGDGGASSSNGMVTVNGGSLTLEDSTISGSSVSGVVVNGGVSGSAAAAAVRRTKFESNGFSGTAKQGSGLFANRTQEVRSGSVGNTGTIDYTYNAADQLTSTSKGGSTTTYGYDGNGNQTSAGARTFSYDLADRLTSTSSGGTTSSYSSDGDDRRLSATTSGGGPDLRYSWDPLAESGIPELTLERTPTGGLVRRYLDGPTGAIAYTTAAGTYSYHHDPLGTITDVSGSAPENRLRYTGQYLDTETSDYHLRARQYNPATGRFDDPDPIENPTTSPYDGAYVYVNGRPTVLVDPLGLFGLGDIAKGVGNFAAGVADTYTGGASTAGLKAVGVHVDTHSKSFKAGQITGYATAAASAGGVVAIGGKVAIKAGGRYLARRAERAALKKGERALATEGVEVGETEGAQVAGRRTTKAVEDELSNDGAHCAAAEEETLYRFGTQRLTAEELDAQAKAAQRAGFPHGVSTSARPPVRPGAPNAPRAAVEQHFPVHDTPTRRNPLHRTVELPDPVTQADADLFHDLFGFPR